MHLLYITIWVLAAYFFMVFVVLRLVVPFMGFGEFNTLREIPAEIKNEGSVTVPSKKLQEIILSSSSSSMQDQKEKLNNSHINWKGNLEQVDDILIIGVRI